MEGARFRRLPAQSPARLGREFTGVWWGTTEDRIAVFLFEMLDNSILNVALPTIVVPNGRGSFSR
jgi:hypothetical protein